ncbi:ATP-grasp domain-containing protein [Schinkia sp. CFF1]
METIIFIETTKSGSSREAIKAARRMGYSVVLITESNKFMSQRDEFTDVQQLFFLKQITEDDVRDVIIKLKDQGERIATVISFVDPFVSMAARLSNELCKSDISITAIKKMEDKSKTREALKNNALTPIYKIFKPSDNLRSFINDFDYKFPVIIKSPVSKASKDVYLVNNRLEMENVIRKFQRMFPNRKILIEEYLIGPQYLVEVVVHKGLVHIIAMIKQELTNKASRFIITGYELQVNVSDPLYQSLHGAVSSIIHDLGVSNAGCHLELRYVNDNWKLIEINPRISGGAMNRMIEEAFGINLVEETIKLFLGEEPALERKFEKNIYTHYIVIGSYGCLLKVTGKNKAAAQPGVLEVYIKPRKGSTMTPPLSMGHRYGYIMATGDTAEEAKMNAMKAARNIKFYLEPI